MSKTDSEEKSNLMTVLIVIGCFVIAVVFFAASVNWGFDNTIKWIAIPVIFGVVIFATRRIWVTIFSSFKNIKIFLVVSAFTTFIAFLCFVGGKLFDLIVADTTPISPAIFGVIVVAWSAFFIKLFSADFDQRKFALSLLVHSAGFAYFHQELWLYTVATASLVSWQWLRIYKKFIWNGGMRVITFKSLLVQPIRLTTMTIGPFLVFYMMVQNLTTNWWQVGTVILSYTATIYLVWAFWLRRWILI